MGISKKYMGSARFVLMMIAVISMDHAALHAQVQPDDSDVKEPGLEGAMPAPPNNRPANPPMPFGGKNDPAFNEGQDLEPPKGLMPPIPPPRMEAPGATDAPPSSMPRPPMPFPPGMKRDMPFPKANGDERPPMMRPRPGMPGMPQRNMMGTVPSRGNDRRPMPPRGPGSRTAREHNPDILKFVPQTCTPAKGKFVWNFEEEELINVLRQVSDLSCETIVVNDAIGKNQKITIIGKSPLSPKDAWDVMIASLGAKGLAMIKQGKTWTVIKKADSKSYATPMYADGKLPNNNEEIGTLFYKAQHASQDALKNVAKVLITKDGLVEPIGDQFIIVIDSNSNIKRLNDIFTQVDIEDAINKIHIIALQNADSKTVEKQLRELFDISAASPRARRRRAGSTENKAALDVEKIIADERTNSLIVVADKESIDKLKEVVALVDLPDNDTKNKGTIHVKKLRFADAKKIADTLSAVVQQGRGGKFGRRRPEDPTNDLFEGEVKVTAHENTNTLVTVASPADYRSLLNTINQLDVRKEQVYVEAVILDIQISDKSSFGLNLFSGATIPGLGGSLGVLANPGGKSIVEGIKTGMTTAGASNISGLGDFSIGGLAVLGNFLSGGVGGIVGKPVPGTEIPSFGAVLQALSENANVDVLSTPYLLTTDNQQAEMSVGEKVPVIAGASAIGGGASGLGMPIQNVKYEDVKLTFKITPHVGADDNVRLDIEQEVNELGAQVEIFNQKQYHIRTKSAKTTLVLKDQQTGVIGGLIHNSTSKTDQKVPFLGDIPILGWLFKNRASKNDRRSLVLIITPYIIKTDEDFKKIVERKLREREEFARLYYGGKIREYNKYIDYDKKAGPLASLLLSLDSEMKKTENGGSGDGNEVIIKPNEGQEEEPKEIKLDDSGTSIEIPNKGETAYLGESDAEMDSGIPFNEFGPEGEEDFGQEASPFGEGMLQE